MARKRQDIDFHSSYNCNDLNKTPANSRGKYPLPPAPVWSQVLGNCYPTQTTQNLKNWYWNKRLFRHVGIVVENIIMHVHKERTWARIFKLKITVLHTRSQVKRTEMNPEILKHEPQYEQILKSPVAYFMSTTGIYSDQSSASHACQPASLHSLPSTNKLAAECEAKVPKHAAYLKAGKSCHWNILLS